MLFTIGVRLEQWPERDSTFVGLAGNQARLWNLRGRGQSSAALVNTDQIDAQHAPVPTAEIDAAPLNITPQKHTRLNVQNGSRQAQTVRLHQPSNPNAVTRSEHVLREPSRANIVLTRRDNTGPSGHRTTLWAVMSRTGVRLRRSRVLLDEWHRRPR